MLTNRQHSVDRQQTASVDSWLTYTGVDEQSTLSVNHKTCRSETEGLEWG